MAEKEKKSRFCNDPVKVLNLKCCGGTITELRINKCFTRVEQNSSTTT